jgi:hypothetical protein
MIPAIIGIAILAIVIYLGFRLLKNVVFVAALIAMVLLASFFIFGSLPDLSSVPIIGQYIQTFPTSTGEAIAVIRNVFYSFKILDASKDAENKLLVTVANTGKMNLSGFRVFVNNEETAILNSPKDPLESGKVTTIQTDWIDGFETIKVVCNQAEAVYP